MIDAIRNPYEAFFLKDRYAGFYLMAVNTENSNRLDYLRSSHRFSEDQIKELDDKEYPKKLKDEQSFTSQNIQKCLELSDIHVNNPREGEHGDSELAAQLAWYVSLMLHPGLVMPTSYESCMQIAYSAKKNSGCISRQVGAVVTDKTYSVKSVGWNSTPQGQVPCALRSVDDLVNGIDRDAYSSYEKTDQEFISVLRAKYDSDTLAQASNQGLNPSYCFKDAQNEVEGEKNQVHTRSLHAEENAFLQISKFGGQKLNGGMLFTTASPCELCAKKAYQIGVEKIFYIDPYPGIATEHILSVGDGRPEMVLFRGAIGGAFHRLYQPSLPYKDELKLLFGFSKRSKRTKSEELEERVGALECKNSELKDRNAFLESEIARLKAGV